MSLKKLLPDCVTVTKDQLILFLRPGCLVQAEGVVDLYLFNILVDSYVVCIHVSSKVRSPITYKSFRFLYIMISKNGDC